MKYCICIKPLKLPTFSFCLGQRYVYKPFNVYSKYRPHEHTFDKPHEVFHIYHTNEILSKSVVDSCFLSYSSTYESFNYAELSKEDFLMYFTPIREYNLSKILE